VNLAAKYPAGHVGLDQERAELLAEPEVTARVDPDRLDVEVGAGQEDRSAIIPCTPLSSVRRTGGRTPVDAELSCGAT